MSGSRRQEKWGSIRALDGLAVRLMGSRTGVRWAAGLVAAGVCGVWALVYLLHWHWLISVVLVMSVLAFAIYGFDKSAARRGGYRVPERALQLAAMLGGAPGALAGQQFFRHKTAKGSFQLVFWAIVVVQVGLVVAYGTGWL